MISLVVALGVAVAGRLVVGRAVLARIARRRDTPDPG